MSGKYSSLYVDNNNNICFIHLIRGGVAILWTLYRTGWAVYLGEVCIYDFEDGSVKFPSVSQFKSIETIMRYFTYHFTNGMWELSWMENSQRNHTMFGDFGLAMEKFVSLSQMGKI